LRQAPSHDKNLKLRYNNDRGEIHHVRQNPSEKREREKIAMKACQLPIALAGESLCLKGEQAPPAPAMMSEPARQLSNAACHASVNNGRNLALTAEAKEVPPIGGRMGV
jgi:hypothetical protein